MNKLAACSMRCGSNIMDLCCPKETISWAVCLFGVSCSTSEKLRLDFYPLIIRAMMITTTELKAVCLECHSQNCVTYWWDDPDFGRDYYGECLDCGGVDCAWEGSYAWNDLVGAGLVA